MPNPFIVETSVKHLHVSKEDFEILFGKGAALTNKRELSQPGQYLCEEKVSIIGPKNEIKNVSILGPFRAFTQVELAVTDCRVAGITAPIRESGDIKGSGCCVIKGPAGEVELKEGVVVAKRHVHMTPADAENWSVENGQIVSISVNSPERSTVFENVVVRVSENFSLAMHIDTDEGNAAFGGTTGTII